MEKEIHLHLSGGKVFNKNLYSGTFIVVNQGGTGSSKTYSILQVLLYYALEYNVHISICSVTLPHLKKGALKDWIDILQKHGIYSEKIHNRSNNSFKINGSFVEFFSLDQPGKARGPRRDILFINEANLIKYDTFQQLLIRTRKKVFIDYNPADEFHWIYDKVLSRDDITFIHSTYLDNTFLPERTRIEIERMKDIDPNFWRIYGEGERGQSKGLIFTHWKEGKTDAGEVFYGLDFGFNNPTALVEVRIYEGCNYVKELLYQSNLTNSDLLALLPGLIPSRQCPIYCDAAEPQRIEELHRAGFNAKPADKSVKDGIDRVKRSPLFIYNKSINLIKELRSYKYQEDKDGNVIDLPVKFMDHLSDAMRYAIHTHCLVPSAIYAIR